MRNIIRQLFKDTAIPSVEFSKLVRMSDYDVRIVDPQVEDGNVSLFELFVITTLVRFRRPEVIFEIGTFNGRTTLNLAANSESSTCIHTLDLPAGDLGDTKFSLADLEKKYVDKSVSGAKYLNHPEAQKINQLYGDSARFDFTPYENAVDFVFVDASHTREYVLNDSEVARRMLRNGKGTILWHDYGRPEWWPGVIEALHHLSKSENFSNLTHIEGTSLVCLMRD